MMRLLLRTLRLVVLVTLTHGLASVPKKNLPASELVNRRKSPALWREDLVLPQKEHHKTRKLCKPPEIMAPAGGWPQLKAAVANGADAVYLGLSTFSARARASNFDPRTELPEAVEYCHKYGVHVYVALNTLVFDEELTQVAELMQLCQAARVDALIVQDIGVAQLAARVAPRVPIHASTQQTITSAEGVDFCASQFNATRVVVGRELSTKEIRDIAAASSTEVEAFVHGALCVSYSGQCFSSEAWGGRSANRGQCAQACRLPYGLVVGGELRDLQDMSYLLSPQDLCGLDQVPDLVEAGVACLKIEGRLKDQAYVAATTRAYRNAVDQAWEALVSKDDSLQQEPNNKRDFALASQEEVSRQDLAQLFSRGQDEKHDGLSSGFFEGTQHQTVVRGRSPRHRGIHLGRVQPGSSWNGLIIQMDDDDDSHIKLGDGLVVDRGMAEDDELGGPVFEIDRDSGIPGRVTIHFGREVEKRWRRADESARKGMGTRRPMAPVGAHVWKTSDATVDKKMRRLSESEPPRRLVCVKVAGAVGMPLTVTIVDGAGKEFIGTTDKVLSLAETSGLDDKKVRKAIGLLGNTDASIDGEIDVSGLSKDAWCPMSWIKEARRRAVEAMESNVEDNDKTTDQQDTLETIKKEIAEMMRTETTNNSAASAPQQSPHVSVLARTFEQVDAVCRLAERGEPIEEIIVDFLEVDGMREAVSRIREARLKTVVASPRIIKPGESGIWKTLLRLEPDGLLVRSTGLLHCLTQMDGTGANVNAGNKDEEHIVSIPELIGDFSLNVANALTATELLDSGLERVTASFDLSANSITSLAELLGTSRASRLEVVAHGKLPIFHTEHCVFARFLSNGNSYLDCGHVCTRNNIHLRDQTGADNLVLADMGCRNTVFASQAQSGAHSIRDWVDAGIRHFRLELVDEDGIDSAKIVSGYLGVLSGTRKPSDVWKSLETVQDSNGRTGGVSHGSLRNTVERKAGAL